MKPPVSPDREGRTRSAATRGSASEPVHAGSSSSSSPSSPPADPEAKRRVKGPRCLIDTLRCQGIHLRVRDGQIQARGPITAPDWAAIASVRGELLKLLPAEELGTRAADAILSGHVPPRPIIDMTLEDVAAWLDDLSAPRSVPVPAPAKLDARQAAARAAGIDLSSPAQVLVTWSVRTLGMGRFEPRTPEEDARVRNAIVARWPGVIDAAPISWTEAERRAQALDRPRTAKEIDQRARGGGPR